MKGFYVIRSKNSNCYLYSVSKRQLLVITPKVAKEIECVGIEKSNDELVKLLNQNGYFDSYNLDFSARVMPENIEYSIANVPQITFEVTDACNLKCEYCAYGKFYTNYDKRENQYLSFDIVKRTLLFYRKVAMSHLNTSKIKDLLISFYGGEPLLNIELIKKTIDFVNKNFNASFSVSYQMTTNGLLLNKYIDLLAKNKFQLLVSLDGNQDNNQYRVLNSGKSSFQKVFLNIKKIQKDYPEYFTQYVNFNAVLHNKNNVAGIYEFFFKNFNKIPMISEINTQGIDIKKSEEFYKMYRNNYENLGQIEDYRLKNSNIDYSLDDAKVAIKMINELCGFSYNDYKQLLVGKNLSQKFRPTGTCLVGQIELFITVNGKILPCERIGQNEQVGIVTNDGFFLDNKKVAKLYNKKFDKISKLCELCHRNLSCDQCLFYLDFDQQNFNCPGFAKPQEFIDDLTWLVNYIEEYPHVYREYRKEMTSLDK